MSKVGSPCAVCSTTMRISGLIAAAVARRVGVRLRPARGDARRLRSPLLALQLAGELPHRGTGDQLDRDAVRAKRERQPLGIGTSPGEEGQMTVPAQRKVEPRRVGVTRAPAMLALDHAPPERDLADDGANRLAQRAATLDVPGRRLDRGGGVEAAVAVGLRRSMQGWKGRSPPVGVSVAEGERLVPRQPDAAVDGRAEEDAAPAWDEEPAAPADDRLGVVGEVRGLGPLGRYLLRLVRRPDRLLLRRLFRQLLRDRILDRLDDDSAAWLADLHLLVPLSLKCRGDRRAAAGEGAGPSRRPDYLGADPDTRRDAGGA